MKTKISNYQQQAINFATKYGVKLTVNYSHYGPHFAGDKQSRHIFKCKLSRNRKSYIFNFGQSLNAGSEEPTLYDILTCLQKYDVGSYTDFCSEFGYTAFNEVTDSKLQSKLYNAVCKEYEGVLRVFDGCMDELQEIQ